MNKGKDNRKGSLKTGAFALLVGALLFELFLAAWCRTQCVRTGYEISDAATRREQLLTVQRDLRVELAHLKSPERIMRIAKERLGLVAPEPRQVVLIR